MPFRSKVEAANLCPTQFLRTTGYFKAYGAKKGENRAMQEDIRKLTTATKEIEAKISNEMWDRQKRWELRMTQLAAKH